MKGLNSFAKEIHKNNCEKGFYEDKKEIGTMLMLCVSEMAEALEADRKKRYCDLSDKEIKGFLDTEYTSKSFFQSVFQKHVKDTFEDEIADTFIRLFDLAGYLNINIEWHIEQKLKYNKTREKKHGKSY